MISNMYSLKVYLNKPYFQNVPEALSLSLCTHEVHSLPMFSFYHRAATPSPPIPASISVFLFQFKATLLAVQLTIVLPNQSWLIIEV